MHVVFLLFMLFPQFASNVAPHDDPVFKELTTSGVAIGTGESVKVAAPSLSGGESALEQSKALSVAAGHHAIDEYLRNSPVAPFTIKMESLTNSQGVRVAQTLDVWFIAHGDLTTVSDENMLSELGVDLKQESGDEFGADARRLDEKELSERGLSVNRIEEGSEAFVGFKSPLLDRVLVGGTIHSFETRTANSILLSGVLDTRFGNDPVFPNQWQSIERNEAGESSLGEPNPYSGFGGYVKATALLEPHGTLLIEVHVVFHEPEGWFRGANLLRSKLPIVIQDQIRSFRRKLAAAQREKVK
jgi:hypothetical protein